MKKVVAVRPGLRALHICHICKGSFLSELPAGLHEITIDSIQQSAAAAQLVRLSEKRSLMLRSPRHLRAEQDT